MDASTESTAIFSRVQAQDSSMVWKRWRARCTRRHSSNSMNAGMRRIEGGRATFGRTLLVCSALLFLLFIVLVIASVLGSQRLPFAASLCALTGQSDCGLSSEQQAILLDLRLPRI